MITPLDIQNKVFKKEFRGYSTSEVDEFLNLIIDGYEGLYRENLESRDKITSLRDAVNSYQALEETLKNTLVVAQGAGEQVQAAARRKADNIIDEAQAAARRLVNDAHEEVKRISYKYDELKRAIDVYRARMTALLTSQLDLLGNVAASEKTLVELIGVNEAIEELEKNGELENNGESENNEQAFAARESSEQASDLDDTAVYSALEFADAAEADRQPESHAATE
jgi:cell division initiation protein